MNILVITETIGFMENKADEIGCNEIKQHYGSGLENWKPFRNSESIVDLLKEFETKTDYNIKSFLFWSKQLNKPIDKRL
ncbi:MAG: hypothetical protein IPG78_03630 [Ignavibacteria bacterium]|nr:hypothetical protein [Ignavibacteria bacterium]